MKTKHYRCRALGRGEGESCWLAEKTKWQKEWQGDGKGVVEGM